MTSRHPAAADDGVYWTWSRRPVTSLLILLGLSLVVATSPVQSADGRRDTADYSSSSLHRITKRGVVDARVFNRTLRIVSIEDKPYTTITKYDNGTTVFSGFIPDIVLALSRRLKFEYTFYAVPDNKYGQEEEKGIWSGLIGECMKRDVSETDGADIAAAAITITAARERVVDFLKPFQHLGLSVVVKRPQISLNVPYTFGIFQPFEPAVWALIILAFLVVGLFLWLMNMFNPYEWAGRHSVGQADREQAEYFNLLGAFWFTFTSLQWQGFERAPRSIAARLLACIWFAFVTISLVTYTAGIVNHLYWASMTHTVTSAKPSRYVDLAHIVMAKDIKYGVIKGGMAHRYIRDVAVGAEFDVIRSYWKTEEGAQQLVASREEGLRRVRAGNYAFIFESLAAKHEVGLPPCDLVTVGEMFGRRSYGFALPAKATPLWVLDELHLAILEMEEEGDMEQLERRWFSDANQCENATKMERLMADINSALYVNEPKSVDVSTFTGPLVLLILGVVLSLAIAFAEMMYYRQCGRYQATNRPQGSQLNVEPDDGNI